MNSIRINGTNRRTAERKESKRNAKKFKKYVELNAHANMQTLDYLMHDGIDWPWFHSQHRIVRVSAVLVLVQCPTAHTASTGSSKFSNITWRRNRRRKQEKHFFCGATYCAGLRHFSRWFRDRYQILLYHGTVQKSFPLLGVTRHLGPHENWALTIFRSKFEIRKWCYSYRYRQFEDISLLSHTFRYITHIHCKFISWSVIAIDFRYSSPL